MNKTINTKEKLKDVSFVKKLTKQNKLNENVLAIINSLTLEELISIKLELSSMMLNNRLSGFNVYGNVNRIVKEALLKLSVSISRNKVEGARFLGIDYVSYCNILGDYGIIDEMKSTKPSETP